MTAEAMTRIAQTERAIASARALFRAGLMPECHAYVAIALRAALDAWLPEDTAEPSSDDRSAKDQRALGALEKAGYRDVDRLRVVLAATPEPSPVPEPLATLPRDAERTWGEAERLSRFTARKLAPVEVQKRKKTRFRAGVALGLAIVAVIVGRLQLRERISASAVFSSEHPARYAFDGIDSTEWLLPESSPGWLEIRYPFARNIQTVTLVNAHNRFYLDRATQRVRVTAFTKDGEPVSVEGAFRELTEKRSVLSLPLEAKGVKRLRVEIVSFFSRGGGLADVQVR